MHVKHRQASSRVRVMAPLLSVLVATASLTACNSTASGNPSGAGSAGTGKGTEAPPVNKVLFDTDFEGVCAGAPQARAADYDKAKSGIHPTVGFGSSSIDSDASKLSSIKIPDGFTRKWEQDKNNLAEVELVACAKRTTDSVVKKCTGYKKDGKDTGQVITLHSATYEVKLYVAKTGQEIAKKTIEATGKDCPTLVMGSRTDDYPLIDEQVVAFIQPFVKTA